MTIRQEFCPLPTYRKWLMRNYSTIRQTTKFELLPSSRKCHSDWNFVHCQHIGNGILRFKYRINLIRQTTEFEPLPSSRKWRSERNFVHCQQLGNGIFSLWTTACQHLGNDDFKPKSWSLNRWNTCCYLHLPSSRKCKPLSNNHQLPTSRKWNQPNKNRRQPLSRKWVMRIQKYQPNHEFQTLVIM